MASDRAVQGDVRMRGFIDRMHPEAALARLRAHVRVMPAEEVALESALGRTLADDVTSGVDVPAFRKSAVDGYGLHAEETFGASAMSPLSFRLVGEVFPGRPKPLAVGAGEAVRIMTGGPIPDGVDAVVMAEQAEERGAAVRVGEPLPPGRNVVAIGEDVRRGDVVLRAGRVLRPQDLGVLASIRPRPPARPPPAARRHRHHRQRARAPGRPAPGRARAGGELERLRGRGTGARARLPAGARRHRA